MKTVTFDDEAYDLLRGLKISPKDSFSDVVKRHLGERRPSIMDSAGAWSDVTDEEVKRMREETIHMFDRPVPRRRRK